MKKFNLLKWGFLCLFCLLANFVWAVDNVDVTLTNTNKVTCTFGGKVASDTEHFAVSGSFGNSTSSYGTVTIDDVTYDSYFKFTTSSSISFTTTEANTVLTLVFGPSDNSNMPFKLTINDSEEEVTTNEFTYTCVSVGKYVITPERECHVFYIGVTEDLEEVTYDPVTISQDDIECWFTGGAPSNDTDFTFSNCKYGTDSEEGSVVINEQTITDCLRLVDSDAEVSFSTSVANTVLTLVFGETETTPNVKIDDTKQTGTSNLMQITLTETGTHTITKADSHYIFYIGLTAPTVETFDVTVSPDSEEDTVTSFGEITVTINGTDNVNIVEDKLSEITLSSKTITSLGRISISANEPTTESEQTIYTLTLTPSITEDGSVTYTLPEGLFTMGEAVSNEVTGTVIIEVEEPEIELTFEPAESDEIIGSLSKIKVTYEYNADEVDGNVYLDAGNNGSVRVTDESGNDVGVTIKIENDANTEDEDDDADNVNWLYLSSPLTAGTYKIVIDGSEGDYGAAFTVEMNDNFIDYAGTTLTYTVSPIECEAYPTTLDADYHTIHLNFNTDMKIDESNTTIKDASGDNAIIYTLGTNDTEYANSWDLEVSGEAITNYAGETITLTLTATDANGAEFSDEYEFTISNGDEDTWTFDPEDGSTLLISDGGLSSITISCTNGILYQGGDDDITITDGDGKAVDVTISCSLTEDDDFGTSCTLTFSPAITTEGTYTVTIPKAYFGVGGDFDDCDETKLTYKVSTTTGINGLMLQAGSDDKFYNLNGQRVVTPRNGVYILNGKKVLVK